MELDSRINKMSDILTCVDVEEAKRYIGQKGCFADHIGAFEDLNAGSVRDWSVLDHVEDVGDLPFIADNIHWRYFLPESKLKPVEKKYRPFTVEEFINRIGDVGGCVRYRGKDDHFVYRALITEIREGNNYVMLGNSLASMDYLLRDFEYCDNGTWIPFGIKE